MTIVRPELPFGATLLEDGRTRFRLWAPRQEQVSVQIEERDSRADAAARRRMVRGAKPRAAPERAYRYLLGSGLAVPDPASRAQADDVHGPSLVVDPRAYRWRNADWRGRPWHETVLYELHAGLFGGFAGVQRELKRLADLGVTAVELMPVNDFPGAAQLGL